MSHHRFSRLWLESDFAAAVAATRKQASRGCLDSDIRAAYAKAALREDTESSDLTSKEDR